MLSQSLILIKLTVNMPRFVAVWVVLSGAARLLLLLLTPALGRGRCMQVPRGGEACGAGGANLPGYREHVFPENWRRHEVGDEEGAHGRGSHPTGETAYPDRRTD